MATTRDRNLVKPRRLVAGDRVAAATLSWGGPGAFPHRYEAGRRQLEAAFGVEVVELPHTLADPADVAAHPQARADDLHRAFADPEIAGIVSTIGGDESIRLLAHLDLQVIRDNPKVFLGYSDTTVTQMACLRAGLVTFYDPAIMSGFAENGGLHRYLEDGVRRMLFSADAPVVWPPNTGGWTVELLDWADPDTQHRVRELRPDTGWRWLAGRDPVEGPLVPACLEVLDQLRGSAWWPDLDGAVLALETSEEAPPPAFVARFLRVLAMTGDLGRLAALLFGRPGGDALPVEAHAGYDAAIRSVVHDEQGLTDLPVVTGLDFGHTDPMWTLPMGTAVRVDPAGREIVFTESGVT
jgi:muramoyltetrapeptide carboxypeptidase LdcA involved in peptidoglycan recycling